MANVSASWRMIEDVLRENAHSVFLALRKPATDTQLRRLESKLDAKLPKDFVKSWKIHDGLRDSYLGQIRLFRKQRCQEPFPCIYRRSRRAKCNSQAGLELPVTRSVANKRLLTRFRNRY